jgi:hypothetical protein
VEVLLEYRPLLVASDGRVYRARACGGEARDGTGRWHGWITFSPLEDGPPIRSARETTQPDRTSTLYWSTGLTPVYLEGALGRALRVAGVRSGTRASRRVATPSNSGGGLSPRASGISPATSAIAAGPCLDITPFDRRFLKALVIAPA